MLRKDDCILFSGGAPGAEAAFGEEAEKHGVEEVNFTFEGHTEARQRGRRVLNHEELLAGDVSLAYVSKLMNRRYTEGPQLRKVLQSIWYQVNHGQEIYVVGHILEDGTVRGGTGWGAEFAKLCNKPLHVFDRRRTAGSRGTAERGSHAPSATSRCSPRTHHGDGHQGARGERARGDQGAVRPDVRGHRRRSIESARWRMWGRASALLERAEARAAGGGDDCSLQGLEPGAWSLEPVTTVLPGPQPRRSSPAGHARRGSACAASESPRLPPMRR